MGIRAIIGNLIYVMTGTRPDLTVPFVDDMRSVNVFAFQIEKTFNLSCLPKDDENVFETRELVQLGDKCFAESFISGTV